MWKTSPAIVHFDVNYHILNQFKIDFAVGENKKDYSKTASKDIKVDANKITKDNNPGKTKSQAAQVKSLGFRQSDVFLEPFEPGICIEENLTQNHRLIFNKFPARKHHVLVITKEPESQSKRLNTSDFMASLLALKTLDESFMYYNSNSISGASQDHKHM